MEPGLAVGAVVVAVLAAVFDVRQRRIPNWLVLTALLAGGVGQSWLGGLPGAGTWLLGAAAGLALFVPLYALGAVGAGDAKLVAALGAMVGPRELVPILLLAGIAGGVQALVVLARSRRLASTAYQLAAGGGWIAAPSGLKAPYAVAIAAGAIAWLALPR